jgi:hypothetical protein
MNRLSLENLTSPVLELRQYTLHPYKRDVLIDLFDREFIETQDAVGMPVLGQFRDLDDPDRFVWLRGFGSMQARHDSLSAFYGGPVWSAHREAANGTMIDSDNVFLLRDAWEGSGISINLSNRPDKSALAIPAGFIDLTIFYLEQSASAELVTFCSEHMMKTLHNGGAIQQGWYVNETSENTFQRLPIRAKDCVLIGVALFEDLSNYEEFLASKVWQNQVAPELKKYQIKAIESHRLTPTARSALHA